MPSLFLGIYTASYDYTAQTDQELTIREGDILYLLEKSTVDDWWKVKKRVLGSDTVEPVGLVPYNYIQTAPVIAYSKALYDYERQTEEEVSFKEEDIFKIYDDKDRDWLLAGLYDGSDCGFIPANYVESCPEPKSTKADRPRPTDAPQNQAETQRPQQSQSSQKAQTYYPTNTKNSSAGSAPLSVAAAQPSPSKSTRSAYDKEIQQPNEEYHRWNVQEVDGRKKIDAVLALGNGFISFNNKQWPIGDLQNYNSEKKHVFLDLTNPVISFDLHVGSKERAIEICTAIGAISGANRAVGLREVYIAASSKGQKMGKIIYDFTSQSSDQVSVKNGDHVIIIDNSRSKDWWMVKNVQGHEGMVPANFIEMVTDINDSKAGPKQRSLPLFRKKGNDQKVNSPEFHISDSSSARGSSISFQSKGKNEVPSKGHTTTVSIEKSRPTSSKIRTWTDRTGSFKVEAEFVGFADNKIHLHKLNGVKIAVAADKMSEKDLEYVESVTGQSFADDKPLRSSRNKAPSTTSVSHTNARSTTTESVNSASDLQKKTEEFDWFEFFLSCGIDISNCQKYTSIFLRDQMDESILKEINSSVLRTLGLKEGDIIRVSKKLDEKFGRGKDGQQTVGIPNGGLFTDASGNLKNNTSIRVSNGRSRPEPSSKAQSNIPVVSSGNQASGASHPESSQQFYQQQQQKQQQQQLQQQQQQQQKAQLTGSLRELADIMPLQPTPAPVSKVDSDAFIFESQQQAHLPQQMPRLLKSENTTNSSTTPLSAMDPFKTGNGNRFGTQTLQQHQLPVISTNIQPLAPMTTGGNTNTVTLAPLQGQLTGGNLMFGNPSNAFFSQPSGGNFQQGLQSQLTGPQQALQSQSTGPQYPFQFQSQQMPVGNGLAISAPMSNLPSSMLFSAPTGNVNAANQFFQQTVQMQQPQQPQQFHTGGPMQFGKSPNDMNNITNQFQNVNLNSSLQALQFQSQPQQQQQQPQRNLFTSQFSQPFQSQQAQQYQPFDQPQTFGNSMQPLRSSHTGGRMANLAAATPSNPFGF